MDVARLWDLNKKSCSIFWSSSGVLEVIDYLDRTGKKNRKKKKTRKNGMHWNMAPDALPGSATFGPLA